ncbi:MAG TPA: sugar phosphate isomerase/epimerase family protein [Vicinamibacterales bacterium]|jgi:inosose dehydratase|nr:sugar phosphate isomerase/epimerase family protein [Vicinamibacterales bacterium]
MVTRRTFLTAVGSAYVASAFAREAAAASMKLGYAAITWGADIDKAMADISAVGFKAIQLRGEAFAQYGDRPKDLVAQLEKNKLTFAVLSSGNLSIDPAKEQEMLSLHVQHAKFVRAAGGKCLQIIDERPKGREVVAEDYKRLGRLLTELGKRTADLGVPMVYHPHMNSTGEKPQELRAIVDASDKRYVRMLFDVAHYQQGGGDPAAAIREYREWIDVVHLKDVRAATGNSTYEFVELGRGRVNLPAVFAALREIAFDKWGIVELDRVPDPGRTPKESAEMNKRYLIDKAGQTL